MKSGRGGFRMLRREQLMQELVHDSYKSRRKPAKPTGCRDCGAVFRGGRWTWGEAGPAVRAVRCPACQRIHDKFPAGYVNVKGPFLKAHRDEILSLIRNCESRERAEHPLARIMGIERRGDAVVVTTTDPHLARGIGDALHDAYKGELNYRYNKEENLLRVAWTR